VSKLSDTLFILHKCDNNIQVVWKAIDAYQQRGPLFSVQHFTKNLSHYLILETFSFLEEYNNFFEPSKLEDEYKERVKMIRDICKPFLQQIKRWRGLKDFRNNIVAHPWRKSNNLVVPLSKNYHIPRTWIEFQFLKDLVHYIHEIINAEFGEEINKSIWEISQLNEKVTNNYSVNDINADVEDLVKKVNIKLERYSKEYDIKLYQYRSDSNSQYH
jgi:hypothetical protein